MATAVVAGLAWVGGVQAQSVVEVPTGDRVLEPSVEEVYRVGSLMGDEWETFGAIRGVGFDRDENMYILDGDNHRIVVVDRDGRFVREFGKEGGGPGEMRMPFGLTVAPDGSLGVLDLGHQAFVLFDSEGNFVRNARNEMGSGLMGGALYHPMDGAVGVRERLAIGQNEGAVAPLRFVPFAEGGEIEEWADAWRPEVEMDHGERSFSASGGGIRISGMPREMAFKPVLEAAVLSDGRVVVADSSAYALKLVNPGGGIGTVVRRGIDPQPVTARIREAELERRRQEIEERAEGGGGGGQRMMVLGGATSGGGGGAQTMRIDPAQVAEMQRSQLENMVFAEEIPVITRIAVDGSDRIWVERAGDRIGEDGPTDVITADGDYLGTIPADGMRIPTAFGPNGLAAYIETDEFDAQYVVVRRASGIR